MEKEKEKEENKPTLCVTTAEKQDTHQTNVGGKDNSTTLIKHNQFGQYQMTVGVTLAIAMAWRVQ
eukprot:2862734-Amphidinium_carterae.1